MYFTRSGCLEFNPLVGAQMPLDIDWTIFHQRFRKNRDILEQLGCKRHVRGHAVLSMILNSV